MKFGYAWTFGETPAPPEKRTPGITAPAGLPAECELGRRTSNSKTKMFDG